jgi:hypothetical protein
LVVFYLPKFRLKACISSGGLRPAVYAMVRLHLLLVFAFLFSAAHAQEPSWTTAPTVNVWPESPVASACEQDFGLLRNEPERMRLLLKLTRHKHVDELTCELLDKLSAAQARMMVFFQARWPECVGALNTLNIEHATTDRVRSAECASPPDEPPRFFSLREYKPRKSKLIGDWPQRRLRQSGD